MILPAATTVPLTLGERDAPTPRKVIFCIPTVTRPYQVTLDSLVASLPAVEAAGWEHGVVFAIGSPYISHARSKMLRKALDAGATDIIFIDHDLSWQPDALARLLLADGDVVCGTYRFKREPEEYMGAVMVDAAGCPVVREDGCLSAHSIPAGFLRITRTGVSRFMREWPELLYGEACAPFVDLFNHGAYEGVWWGEDYAFARRWREKCGQIWLIPDLQIDHHTTEAAFPGHFHDHLRRQPGGDLHEG
jgi:hypothetical protein